MKKLQLVAIAIAHLFACVPCCQAGLIFSETFDSDTSTTSQTLSAYPGFSFVGGTLNQVQVVGGILALSMQPAGGLQQFVTTGFAGDLQIDLDLGKDPGGEFFYTGLRVGDNEMLFHPGTSSPFPAGAFRVNGPGGFGNQSMGFVPAASTLHHMQVSILEATGEFSITVTDGDNPSNSYSTNFTNPGYTAGDAIGFTTNGVIGTVGVARFDNFFVHSSVPEPSSFVLLTLGCVFVGAFRCRRPPLIPWRQ